MAGRFGFRYVVMTQEERWMQRYEEMVGFVESNKRRPSKYVPEERNQWNWLRHNQKMLSQGLLKPERVELFGKLLDLCERYRRVNQYG